MGGKRTHFSSRLVFMADDSLLALLERLNISTTRLLGENNCFYLVLFMAPLETLNTCRAF